VNDAKMLDRYHGWAVCGDGSVFRYQIITGVIETLPELPHDFSLRQNYPNPFNPSTTIEFEAIRRSLVTIRLFDSQGKEVRTLVNGQYEPGVYRLRFDGSNLASGIYYYTMKTGTFSETRQMALVK
jgi:hypothetical protein